MGRYFNYTIHPLSVGELIGQTYYPDIVIAPSKIISEELFQALFDFGGFPDPFVKKNSNFHNRWTKLRSQ